MFKSLLTFSILLLAYTPAVVLACEGECIVGITDAFLTNYTRPLGKVFTQIAETINTKLIPPASRPKDPITLVLPIIKAYTNASYASLENAIFPSYFHGKCQRFSKDGSQPKGCPNPDCPVVCGTPGSLVHFYPDLRYIVFNDTRHLLEGIVSPGSKPFEQVESNVQKLIDVGNSSLRKRVRGGLGNSRLKRVYDTVTTDNGSNSTVSSGYDNLLASSSDSSRSDYRLSTRSKSSAITKQLADILHEISLLLEIACGGNANNGHHGLPKCSWAKRMKEYILTFP